MLCFKDAVRRSRPRSTRRFPNGWLAGCASGRKQFLSPMDVVAQEMLKRKRKESWAWTFLPHTGGKGFHQALLPVSTQETCLWPIPLPCPPLCLACKLSVLGPMCWNDVDGGHMCAKCLQLGWSWLGSDYLLVGMGRGGLGRKFNSHSLVICKSIVIGSC